MQAEIVGGAVARAAADAGAGHRRREAERVVVAALAARLVRGRTCRQCPHWRKGKQSNIALVVEDVEGSVS